MEKMAYSRENIGLRGIYVYFPRFMVRQADLEAADGCNGKYTVGLGQEAMTFCGDREDVVSMAATAVMRVLKAAGVSYIDIGKIAVGTETGVDRSKSVMSYLVQYFQEHGNTTLQGSDHQHGCYGGTSALFSVADWVASPSWDGRLGLAVATDIAVYPEGSPARPTGGGGAAALLVGPDAPLVLEPYPWRSNFSAHTFDFFKPHGHPLYPIVDGPATTLWFTKAADACAAQLHRQLNTLLVCQQQFKAEQQHQQQHEQQQEQPCKQKQMEVPDAPLVQKAQHQQQPAGGLLQQVDYFISHAPYNKIVRKIFARIVLQDMLRAEGCAVDHDTACCCKPNSNSSPLHQVPPLPVEAAGHDPDCLPDSSITDKQLERAILKASSDLYDQMVSQGADLQRQLGNLYTASLYSGLAALVSQQGEELVGKRVLCFSFGSGVVSSMFVLRGRQQVQQVDYVQQPQQQWVGTMHVQQQPCACELAWRQQTWWQQPCSLRQIADKLQLQQRLVNRLPRSVADFDAAMASLRASYGAAPYKPSYGLLEELEESMVYLVHIDERHRRLYGSR